MERPHKYLLIMVCPRTLHGASLQHNPFQAILILSPLASCLLPLASCLLPLASCLSFYLTFTYTIGFGKQVKRGNEVEGVSAGSDGILH